MSIPRRPLSELRNQPNGLAGLDASGRFTSPGSSRIIGADLSGLEDARPLLVAATAPFELGAGVYRVASNLTLTHQVNFLPGALIRPDTGVFVHLAGGYVASDYQHVFDISAGGSVTCDRVAAGYVTPFQWGATGTGTGDDTPAITAASRCASFNVIRQEYAHSLPVKFPKPSNYFRLASIWYVNRTADFYSEQPVYLRNAGAVELRVATGLLAGVVVISPGGVSSSADYKPENPANHPTVPGIGVNFGGMRSSFRNLVFKPETGASVRYGFVHNTVCHLEKCVATGFSGAGFFATAQTSGSALNLLALPGTTNDNTGATIGYNGSAPVFGNTNGSTYFNCYAVNNLGHGFVSQGNNSGTVSYKKCDATGNKGSGFLENTTIGCEYIANHTAQNTVTVIHNGVYYHCIKGHLSSESSEPGVGSDWRRFWMQNTATIFDFEWTSGVYYIPSGGANVCSNNSRSSFIGHYSEGGIESGIIARDKTSVIGGNGVERTYWHPESRGATVLGAGSTGFTPVIYTARTDPGDPTTDYGMSVGMLEGFTSGRILSFGSALDDPTNKTSALRLAWSTSRSAYQLTDASRSSHPVWQIAGSGNALDGTFMSNGLAIADGGTTMLTNVRIRAATNLAAITDAAYGPAIRGDTWIYTQPVAGGFSGARCVTAGTIGVDAVIKQFGAIEP